MGKTRPKKRREMLIVDGYNVIYQHDRYLSLRDEPDAGSLDHDVFFRAREALVGDVATFAQGRYDAVIVYDGAGNIDPARPSIKMAGVRIIFSKPGESADSVIEGMATTERNAGRKVTVVSSDRVIQSTVVGEGVTRLSSHLLVQEMGTISVEVKQELADRTHGRFTLGDRLDPQTKAKLDRIVGRR